MRGDIEKWTVANGNQPTAKRGDIPESTIRAFIKSYNEGQFRDEDDLESIPR